MLLYDLENPSLLEIPITFISFLKVQPQWNISHRETKNQAPKM